MMTENKTPFSKAASGCILIFALCLLFVSCASSMKTVSKRSNKSTPSNGNLKPSIPVSGQILEKKLVDKLKNFRLEILSEKYGLCPGQDGKDIIFLGRDARFQLILQFNQILPPEVMPQDLIAKIRHLYFAFSKRTSEKEFVTNIVNIGDLEDGINIKPTSVEIYYAGHYENVRLGKQGMLSISTAPPPKPVNLQVKRNGIKKFLLTWTSAEGFIKEYLVQEWNSDRWITLSSGSRSLHFSFNGKPEGRIRIVAVDCALNKAFSKAINLKQHAIFREQKIRVRLLVNKDPGSTIAKEIFQGFLVNQGYQIVAEETPADFQVKVVLISRSCFKELSSNCYDIFLKKLEIRSGKGEILKTLPVLDKWGKEKYIGHSQPSDYKDQAIRSGVGMLCGRLKYDFLVAMKRSLLIKKNQL